MAQTSPPHRPPAPIESPQAPGGGRNDPPPGSSRTGRIVRWVVWLTLGLVLGLSACLALAQTRTAKAVLTSWIEQTVESRTGTALRVEGLRGIVPLDVRVDRLVLGEDGEPWLRVEGFSFQWRPEELLRGRLFIGHVQADRVNFLRRPPSPPNGAAPETGEATRPSSLPAVVVQRVSVPRLVIHRPVLGDEARLSVSGSMDVSGSGSAIRGSFQVRRLDKPEERAGVRWVLETAPVHLELDAHVLSPDQGMLFRLAGIQPGASSLRLSGKGPPDDWRGRLEGQSASWGEIRSELLVQAGTDRLSVKATGEIQMRETLVPAEAAGLLEDGGAGFSVQVVRTDRGLVSVDRLALNAAGAELLASGRFSEQERTGSARVALTLPDLARIHGTGLPEASGRVEVEARLRGPLVAPEADVSLGWSNLRVAGMEAGTATASLRLRPGEKAVFPFLHGLQVMGEGSVQDLTVRTLNPPLQREHTRWGLDMVLDSPEAWSISTLRVADKGLESVFSGRLRLDDALLDGRLRLAVEELGEAPWFQGKGVRGKGALSALVQASGISRSVFVDVQGRVDELSPLPDGFQPLLAGGVAFQGRVSLLRGRTARVSGFEASLPAGEVRMEGEADLEQGTGRASMQVRFPEVGALSAAAGLPVSGEASIRAEARGPFGAPEIDAEVTIRDALVNQVSIQTVRAMLDVERLRPAPRGRVRMEAVREDLTVTARADATVGSPWIEIKGLSVQGAGTDVSGDLRIHTPSSTVEGRLNGAVEDLASLRPFLGHDLSGRAGLALHLFREEAAQNVEVDLRMDEMVSSMGSARRVDLHGKVRNAFRSPAGEAGLRVKAFRRDRLDLKDLVVQARGDIETLSFDLQGSGRAGVSFQGASKGRLRWSEGQRVLELESLEGRLGTHDLRLEQASEVRLRKNGFATPGLRVRAGRGTVSLTGSLAGAIDLEARVEALPLSLLALAGAPSLEGSADAVLRLSGSPRVPRGEVELTARGVRPSGVSSGRLPRFRIDGGASYEEDRLKTRLSVAQGEDTNPLEAEFTLPLEVSLSPLTVDLPPGGEMQGRVQADVDLEPVPVWFGLEGHRTSGRLLADLSLSGSPAEPAVKGEVRVDRGGYELLRSGSVFREVSALLRVDGRQVVLEHAGAVDGDGGHMEAEGRLRLLPERGFPFEVDATLDGFRLVGLDDLRAKTGGEVAVSGSMREARVQGRVQVSSLEARIPDRLPPKIHEIEVVDAQEDGQTASSKGTPSGDDPSGPEIVLDLVLEIPGRAFVRGRGLDSEWKGRLQVEGNTAASEITGELSMVRGHYDLFGERFSLTAGTVVLNGSHPPDPLMEVTAERRMEDLTGRVILSGRPSSLRVQVTSDPPMPRDEVMARLLFGRSLASISPIQALKLARATDALAGGKAFGFLDRAQQAIGLDQVEVIQSDGAQGSTALSVGKYVGENAYVAVEKGLGTDEGRVSVEVEVTPRISVETEVGADAAGGVEVKWKWDY